MADRNLHLPPGGRYACLIGFMDDYSRFIVGADLFRGHTVENVLEVFRVTAGKYQPPRKRERLRGLLKFYHREAV